MSAKGKDKREQDRLASIMQKRTKTQITPPPPYMYIVCEGEETEPNYISGLVDELNKKHFNYSSKKRIILEGTGKNTQSLLNHARKQVEKKHPLARVVWLMYDADSFPKDKFDNTASSAEKKQDCREYKVAWSNECIELWFLLHFQDLEADIGREQYVKKLKKFIPDYEKNLENIYDLLKDKTPIAIERAKKLYKSYNDKTPSKCRPATRVFELVEELQKYL